jgi:DNA-directed RNA polymerase specialized sigma24 family protein
MRRILVDHARKRVASQRPGELRVDLEDVNAVAGAPPEELLAVHAALDRLAELDARQAQVVELRYFAGLNVEETAQTLGISEKTVNIAAQERTLMSIADTELLHENRTADDVSGALRRLKKRRNGW